MVLVNFSASVPPAFIHGDHLATVTGHPIIGQVIRRIGEDEIGRQPGGDESGQNIPAISPDQHEIALLAGVVRGEARCPYDATQIPVVCHAVPL